jgi:lysine 6-dehydrogenase
MRRFLVLGAGLQGSACALDLLATTDAAVTLADRAPEHTAEFLAPYRNNRLSLVSIDARDGRSLRELIRGHDAVLSALPYYVNVDAARAAIDGTAHFSDLGGNIDVVGREQALNRAAETAGVSVIPDCGVAPGLANILAAEGIGRLDAVESVKMYVGGLPQRPQPPLNYTIVYSLEGVLDYYTTPSTIRRGGQLIDVDALSEVEEIDFPAVAARLEAFHTSGGASTMPWIYQDIPTVQYKTLRYPGHAALMRAIRDLGLFAIEPVDVRGQRVVPRDLFIAVADPRLRRHAPDLVAVRVEVVGTKAGQPAAVVFQLVDYYDAANDVSAMMRTTGYSLSIVAQMQTSGRIAAGVRVAYQAVPFDAYVAELRNRGIVIQDSGVGAVTDFPTPPPR